MKRYAVNVFDLHTFIVIDQYQEREICVCQNYDSHEDAKQRANEIAFLLNKADTKSKTFA